MRLFLRQGFHTFDDEVPGYKRLFNLTRIKVGVLCSQNLTCAPMLPKGRVFWSETGDQVPLSCPLEKSWTSEQTVYTFPTVRRKLI